MPIVHKTVNTAICDRCGINQEYVDRNELAYWKILKRYRAINLHETETESILCPRCYADYLEFMKEKLPVG